MKSENSDFTWIETVPYEEATGRLKKLYDRIKDPAGNVDNIMMAHSLRPHSMDGHMSIYKNVLHHTGNTLPKWLLELVGVYVSYLNGCEYCYEHHFAGMARLMDDEAKSTSFRSVIESSAIESSAIESSAIESGDFGDVFTEQELAILAYAKKLSQNPADMVEPDVQNLRDAGLHDGEILEINQVTSYFAYANRMVLGLGINTKGDVLGTSPNSSDGDDWSHS